MRLSLEARMDAKMAKGEVDNTAMSIAKRELKNIRKFNELASGLMELEEGYSEREEMREALAPGLLLLEVRRQPVKIENRYHFLVHSTEYDPFNFLLVASDTANQYANIRVNANNLYGPQEDWIIWAKDVVQFGSERIAWVSRYWLSGELSELRRAAPDSFSRLISEASGLSLQGLKSPIFIARASAILR